MRWTEEYRHDNIIHWFIHSKMNFTQFVSPKIFCCDGFTLHKLTPLYSIYFQHYTHLFQEFQVHLSSFSYSQVPNIGYTFITANSNKLITIKRILLKKIYYTCYLILYIRYHFIKKNLYIRIISIPSIK